MVSDVVENRARREDLMIKSAHWSDPQTPG